MYEDPRFCREDVGASYQPTIETTRFLSAQIDIYCNQYNKTVDQKGCTCLESGRIYLPYYGKHVLKPLGVIVQISVDQNNITVSGASSVERYAIAHIRKTQKITKRYTLKKATEISKKELSGLLLLLLVHLFFLDSALAG